MTILRNILPFILLVTQLVAACTPAAQNLEGEHWVIFSAEKAKEEGLGEWLFAGGAELEYWMPTEENILALEEGLPAFLESNADYFYTPDAPVWERLDEYNRQYIGLVLDGKQTIYANYFCHSTGVDWKQDFVFVMDGGSCYFQFQYDPNTGEFHNLQVNGEA